MKSYIFNKKKGAATTIKLTPSKIYFPRMVEIESSRKDKRNQIFELNAEEKKITIKLDALRDFHAKRDIKVRQDLAKEQELRNNIEGDIKTFADREKFLNDQIEGRFKNVFRLSGN